MLRSSLVLFALVSGTFLGSCGPAAEDRSTMLYRSKLVQDSIANVIRMQMAEAEAPGPNQAQVVPMPAPAAVVTHTNAAGQTHTHAPGESHNH
jgi:hypothetical protein